ncbi:MAG: hypothetical protein IRZ16_12530 [Myxococcaceae bacterium]|nr:hypothetical protein [Myxococcaceae bacterium]
MIDSDVRVRIQRRLEELVHLEAAAGAGSICDAEGAARALLCAGDLLRRRGLLGDHREVVERLLRKVSSAGVAAFARSVDLDALETRLRRAAEEAVEATLPESPEDAGTWAAWAAEGLEERDALESQLWALEAREVLGFEGDRSARERLKAAVAAQDRALRGSARWWVGLNDLRRAERDALDPMARAAAWWYVDRADCDDLLPLLAGELTHSAHAERCPDCQRDLDVVRTANQPRPRHLSEDELWRYDLGTLSRQERALVDAHVRICLECSRALAALEEGEEAIRELTATATPKTDIPFGTVIELPTARNRPQNDEPEVLATHADFRLLLFRRGPRAKLVVQEASPGRVAAAAVFLPTRPDRALSARPGPDGFEVELPGALRAHGAARVRVQLGGPARAVEHDVPLA